jgi:hypothetical protein
MSLLQRVTSFESLSPERFSPERGRSPTGSRDRKLSFSPLPESWSPPAADVETQAIGAFEVPKAKRICKSLSFQSSGFVTVLLRETMIEFPLTEHPNSTSLYSSHLLSFRRWHCLWLRSYQTSPHSRTCIPQPLHEERTRGGRTDVLRPRDSLELDVHRSSSRNKCRSSPDWSYS